MKTFCLTIIVSIILWSPHYGFAPLQSLAAGGKLAARHQNQIDDITHELEELGQETKPNLLKEPHGFNEFHESLVHKLRRAAHEKDIVYHQALDELERREKSRTSIDKLMNTLQDIQKHLRTSKAYAIAWEATEVNLRNEVAHRQKQEKNKHAIQELLKTLQRIETNLTESQAYALAWETAEVELYREKKEHEQEHESVRRLLWQALKLSGRRIKHFFQKK